MPKINETRKKLLEWYNDHGRSFPWRHDRIGLYRLLACEIFLWKTQANTVDRFIKQFFKKYPRSSIINEARTRDIARDVKKLGLSNRRAKQLKVTYSEYTNRNIPISESEFRKKFKVGQYIARSVLSIRYGQNLFPVDQNINRFFKRYYGKEIRNIRKIKRENDIFLRRFYGRANKKLIWAVIDFASLVCKSKKPSCRYCLIKHSCCFYKTRLKQ